MEQTAKTGEAGAGMAKPVSPQDRMVKPGERSGTGGTGIPPRPDSKAGMPGEPKFYVWQAEVGGGILRYMYALY